MRSAGRAGISPVPPFPRQKAASKNGASRLPLKAISPVVATVVLVAAAILIGSVAVVWVSGFVSQQTLRATESACGLDIQYTLSGAQVNSTGGVRVALTNTGQKAVGNFTVELELTNGSIFRVPAPIPAATDNLTTSQTDFVIIQPCSTSCASLDNLVKSVRVLNNVCKPFHATTTTVTYKTPFG